MSTETKARVKQILMDCCGGGFSIATDILHEEFIIIPNADTCDGNVSESEHNGVVMAGSGPEYAEALNSVNPNWLRNRAINFLNIADYIENRDAILAEKEASATAARDKRADELARNFSGWPTADFAGQPASTQLAILKVIELEASK